MVKSFEELYKLLDEKENTYQEVSDKKKISDLNNIRVFTNIQKEYYDKIPEYIRTKNTLHGILTKITQKINLLEDDKMTPIFEAAYIEEHKKYNEEAADVLFYSERLGTSQTELSDIKADNQKLINERTNLQAELTNTKNELKNIQNEIDLIRDEIMPASIVDTSDINSVKYLINIYKKLKESFEKSQTELNNINVKKTSSDKLLEKCLDITKQNEEFIKQAETMSEIIEDLRKEVGELKQENTELNKKIKELQINNTELTNRINSELDDVIYKQKNSDNFKLFTTGGSENLENPENILISIYNKTQYIKKLVYELDISMSNNKNLSKENDNIIDAFKTLKNIVSSLSYNLNTSYLTQEVNKLKNKITGLKDNKPGAIVKLYSGIEENLILLLKDIEKNKDRIFPLGWDNKKGGETESCIIS